MPIDESIHNYYSHLVEERIFKLARESDLDSESLADITCVALNHLPPKYIRHDVDMAFYISPQERAEINERVANAVDSAVDFVSHHHRPT